MKNRTVRREVMYVLTRPRPNRRFDHVSGADIILELRKYQLARSYGSKPATRSQIRKALLRFMEQGVIERSSIPVNTPFIFTTWRFL